MPLTIASVLGFIPTNLWRQIKKFVTKDKLIVFDLPFKMSTKYTPALLLIMMCLSFANQFVRNVEIDCMTSGGSAGGGGSSRSGGYSSGGGGGGGGDNELNDFCWNHETFLVAKALEPEMRGYVTYPGVSGYNKDKDLLVRQRYYKQVWLILGKLAVLAFLPYFFWTFRGTEKVKALVEVQGSDDTTEEDQRVGYFLETIGFNGSFAYHYLLCKLCAAATPFAQWYYLCGFIGKRYKYYGVDVLTNFMDETSPWPNPMDALFPKIAKCEWARYGYGGDMEVKSAQCQLPMNNMTQWSFFIYWWWLALVFLVNFLSSIRLLFVILPPCRRFQYQKFVARACREDLEKARTSVIHSRGQVLTTRHSKSKVIDVNLSFGDWLVLSFIKRNLPEWQFRDFVRKMVTTENIVLQLRPVPTVYEPPPALDDVDEKRGANWTQDEQGNLNPGGNIMEIGFLNSIINPPLPPRYSACDNINMNNANAPSDCDTNELAMSSPSISPNEGLINPGATFNNVNEYSINITPPVKINRSNLNLKNKAGGSSSGGGGSSGSKKDKQQAPKRPDGPPLKSFLHPQQNKMLNQHLNQNQPQRNLTPPKKKPQSNYPADDESWD